MTHEEFDNLVQFVEQGVGRNHAALRRRAVLLALVGYVGLITWLLVVLVIASGFFAAMLWADIEGKIVCGMIGTLVLLLGGYASLKALLVKLPPPEGRIVTRAETPALHAMLDELQLQLHSAPFHRVLIDNDLNAGVVQVPRLGPLGWSRNYLLIGLPLLDALSPEEMRSVLAHEFAHLSRAHGRVSHWLYRLRRSWQRVFEQMSRPHNRNEASLRPLVVKFVDWFWPRFNAHAFVLSRANEYEADAHAARIVGATWSGSSLSRLALMSRRTGEKFWPAVWQEANEKAAPPPDVFARLRDALHAEYAPTDRSKWINEALLTKTTNADTHPCLTERLGALKIDPAAQFPVGPAPVTSAETLLGAALETIRADVQKLWEKEVAEQWKHRHGRASALTHRLDSLHQAVANPAADVDSLWDEARVLLDLHGDEKAEPLLRQIITQRPSHVAANFHLGRLLLEDRKPEGEEFLERAMAEDEDVTPQACALLHDHHRRSGRMDRLKDVTARLDRHEKEVEASRAERRELSAKDTLVRHELTEPELAPLLALLAKESGLSGAWLGRKELKHLKTQKLFLLCVEGRRAWHRLPNRERDQAIVSRLSQAVKLPGRLFVFCPSGSFGALAKKLKAVPGAKIFSSGT